LLHSEQFRGQKSLGALEKPQEMPNYMLCQHKKITSQTFSISSKSVHGILNNDYVCTGQVTDPIPFPPDLILHVNLIRQRSTQVF